MYMIKHPLNIKGYPKNAAKNFSLTKLIVYTAISLLLTIMLLVTTIQYDYAGTALLFTSIAFFLIAGYTVLNVLAIIEKLKK